MTRRTNPLALRPFANEAEFQMAVVECATLMRLLVFHTYDSRRSVGGGFPDLTIVGREILFVELKTETGVVSPEQQMWGNAIERAHGTFEVWRPDQWTSGYIVRRLTQLRR